MVPADKTGEAQVAFAERLLALLDEGSFSTTYKYALLLALLDCCLEHADATGRPPSTVTPLQLAERVLELYWPHTAPFPGAPNSDVLRQSNTGQAEVVSLIRQFRSSSLVPPGATLAEARTMAPEELERVLAQVEWKLVEMPLPRLQRVGNSVVPFLYRIGWDEKVRKREFQANRSDYVLEFAEGAAEHLVRLTGLIRPLVQRLWAARVAQYNRSLIADAGLEEFLFAAQRLAAVRVRLALTELQEGRCFYTGERLRDAGEVDHFLPWVRYPNNAIENLVVASRRSNAQKRAFLVASPHLAHWRQRNALASAELRDIASAARWESRPDETLNMVRAIYLRLPDGVQLWTAGKHFVLSRRTDLNAALR